MVLEFLLIAALEDGSSLVLKRFQEALVCNEAVSELDDFQKLHEKDGARSTWIAFENAGKREDSSYEPQPYPAEKFPDSVLSVEERVNRLLGEELNEKDPWADVPILTRFDTNIRYTCIASIK